MGTVQVEEETDEVPERNGTTVSEKKRLESLKRKKEAYRAKEQAVQNALKNLDGASKCNKIIFDDNIEDILAPKVKRKKKKDLFDDVDDDADNDGKAIEPNWEKNDLQFQKSGKTLFGKYAFGNDERFKLDERFIEEDDSEAQTVETKAADETDLQKEKEWQLDLLGNILGVPLAPRNNKSNVPKKSMIRYNPTEKAHQSYEIIQDQSELSTKKSKKRKKKEQAEHEAKEVEAQPVEVSKDIYYKVSEDLSKSLKEEGGFSLLQKFGKEDTNEECDEKTPAPNEIVNNKKGELKFAFDTTNPFKYDSSDPENEEEQPGRPVFKSADASEEQPSSSIPDRFFFEANDVRFNEAKQFFSKTFVPIEEFNNLRRELKQIMRTKIRQNQQKSRPWGGKKKIAKTRSQRAS